MTHVEVFIAGMFAGCGLAYYFAAEIIAKAKSEAAKVGASVAAEAKKL
jgi:hypothetical protein